MGSIQKINMVNGDLKYKMCKIKQFYIKKWLIEVSFASLRMLFGYVYFQKRLDLYFLIFHLGIARLPYYD
jgi:hypothetical protein